MFLSKLPGVTQKNLKVLLRKGNSLPEVCSLSKDDINVFLQNSAQSSALYDALHKVITSAANEAAKTSKGSGTYRGKRKLRTGRL